MTEKAQRPILPASTIVLLRDGETGVEILVVRRHGKSGFMAGATVFPGGKVDATDGQLGDDDEAGPGFFVCAARELHEEAAVLLAKDASDRRVPASECGAVLAELDGLRDGHRIDAAAHHALLTTRGWQFDVGQLVPFAHWVTPEVEPKRFDTWFFATAAPAGQQGRLDGHETTALGWLSAKDSLQRHEADGDIWLPPPTYHTLHTIADLGDTVAEVLAGLARCEPVPRWMPHFIADSVDGPLIVLPDDPLHPDFAIDDVERRHRFVLRGGRFRYDKRG